ncbi:MAG: hypothetical protein ACJ763_09975 [Bdellovibrionia bacterium]
MIATWVIRIISLAASLAIGSASAKEIQLFQSNGNPRTDYVSSLHGVDSGDVLIFSDGSRHKILKRLGCGGTTCVFGLSDHPGLALRIPSSDGYLDGDGPLIQGFIDQFVDGKAELQRSGVPSVELHRFRSGEYAVVDRVESVTRLDQFFADPYRFSEASRKQLAADLINFAEKTAPFESIGDFKADQLHYVNGKGWILIDWTDRHRLRGDSIGNVFDLMFTDKQSPVRGFYNGLSKRALFVQNVRRAVNKAITLKRTESRGGRCGLLIKRALFDLTH